MGEVLAGRRRWIWVAVAVVVLALIVYGVVHALTAGASEKPKAAATVAVDRGSVSTEVGTTGTVEPSQTLSLSFTAAGTVTTVSVRAGSTVHAGEVLAKVDDTDAAQTVSDAQTALDNAQQQLTDARDSAAKQTASTAAGSTSTGCVAAAAYITTTTSPTTSATPTAGASSHPTSAPTSSRTTTPTASRTAGSGSHSGGTGTGTSTGTGSGSTCGRSTSGSGTGTGSGSGSGSGSQGGGTDSILSAQQRVISANTTLENAEDALDGTTITAPIAGRILSVAGKVGTQVSSGSAFLTLADPNTMQITADFPEADADHLAVKQSAAVALADQDGKTFKAVVSQVDPTGTSDGTLVRYGVQLSFVKSPADLLVGQSATVAVTTGAKTDVLRVPSSAVHNVAGSTGTVLKNGAQVQVGIGLHGDQYTEITTGLSEGDQVVRSW
jgi:HlyD family secretion protein